jgi:glycerol-3-phosphate acyltransferase PlsY
MILYLSVALISYLLGSIPFGYLLVRFFKGEDVRVSGSGNIGATNVARKSPALGVATLALDAAKGLAAVLLAKSIINGKQFPVLMTTAALFAVIGHMFPLWLKFRGGKGVATSLGAFILLTPKSIACMLALFLILALAFRYVSLASIAVAAAFPLLAWIFHEHAGKVCLIMIALVSALVIWKHRKNIRRIADGTESRLGRRKKNQLETEEPPATANRDAESFGAFRQ